MRRQPVRILLIDDDSSFVTAFSGMVNRLAESCPVLLSTAACWPDALKCIAETPPDAVFLSLDRPGIGRRGVIKRIKTVDPLIPVIVMTDVDHEKSARRAVERDALDYYVREELTDRCLAHIVRSACSSRRDQDRLAQTSGQWRATFDSIPDWIMIVDEQCRIAKLNRALADSFGRHPREVVGNRCRGLIGGVDWSCEQCPHDVVSATGQSRVTEVFNHRLSIHQTITAAPLFDGRGAICGTSHVIKDVTEKKHADLERETLIEELREALSRVKTLSGLLPICASCKQIRDDHGNWNPIETYIHDRSNAQFSHGICPECAAKLYPDHYRKK